MSQRVRLVVSGASAAASAALVGGMLWFCRYGLDLTDEGYYLNWLSDPGLYPWSTTQFGYVYRPLHELLGGDIALLRQVNVLLVFGLAWVLCHLVLVRVVGWQATSRWEAAAHSAALACSSLVVFDLWLLTPSYNSLAAQGMLVVAIGAAVVSREQPHRGLAGWALLGVGGWLVFMAKPTTAAGVGAVVLVLLLAAGTLRARGAVVAVLTSGLLVVASALLIDGSVRGFVERLRTGAEQLSVLGGGHDLAAALRWDSYSPSGRQLFVLLCLTLAVLLAARVSSAATRPRGAAFALGILLCLAAIATATRGADAVIIYADPFSNTLLLALPLAALLLVVSGPGFGALRHLDRRQWAFVGSFAVLPHVFAFGTNNNYWRSAGLVVVFWILAGVVLLASRSRRADFSSTLLPFGIAAQVLTLLLLVPAVQSPYRQPQPLYDNSTRLEVGESGSSLVLAAEVADHLARTRALVHRAGFEQGDPMLDLTGRSPGVLHAWGASSVVQPWSIGGYPGSAAHETAALSNLPCRTVADLWLLLEPEGPRSIPGEVLLGAGVRVPDDFRVAATWVTPVAVTADGAPRTQLLLRPTRSAREATDACVRARKERP